MAAKAFEIRDVALLIFSFLDAQELCTVVSAVGLHCVAMCALYELSYHFCVRLQLAVSV